MIQAQMQMFCKPLSNYGNQLFVLIVLLFYIPVIFILVRNGSVLLDKVWLSVSHLQGLLSVIIVSNHLSCEIMFCHFIYNSMPKQKQSTMPMELYSYIHLKVFTLHLHFKCVGCLLEFVLHANAL